MVLNLLALASLAAAIVAAFFLFRRLAPRVPTMAGNVCLRCGTPAAALSSFTCPGCGHDIREAGLGPTRGRSAVVLFWLLVVYTCAYLVAATIVGNVLFNVLPRVHTVSRNTSMRVSLPQIFGVELYYDGRGPDEHNVTGTITGEMYGAAAAVVLEVDRPALTWRLLDMTGKQFDAGDRLDGSMIYRWMELAGAPTDTPVAHSDAAHIANAVGQLAGVKIQMPPVPGSGGALSLSYSSASGGGSASHIDPRWPPLIMIGGAAAWLAGAWLILRIPDARPRAAPTPVPSRGETASTPEGTRP